MKKETNESKITIAEQLLYIANLKNSDVLESIFGVMLNGNANFCTIFNPSISELDFLNANGFKVTRSTDDMWKYIITWDVENDTRNGQEEDSNASDENNKVENHPAGDSLCEMYSYPDYQDIDDPDTIKMKFLACINGIEKMHPGMKFSIIAAMKYEYLKDVYDYMKTISGNYVVYMNIKYCTVGVSNYKKSFDDKAYKDESEEFSSDPIWDVFPENTTMLWTAEDAYNLSKSPLFYVTQKIQEAINLQLTCLYIGRQFVSGSVAKALKDKHYMIEYDSSDIDADYKSPLGPMVRISWNKEKATANEEE